MSQTSAVATQRPPDTTTKPPSDSSRPASGSPFLGAQPYRSENSHLFFGREEVTLRLAHFILANACITLFGESGVGKSSLMQAGVIPLLEKDYGFRLVRVDAWMTTKTPLEQLVQALFASLKLGPVPTSMTPAESLELAVDLAEQQSALPLLIYLDQLEQLLLPGRDTQQVERLLESLEALTRKPIRGLQLVLSMREDYLGRFRDRARGRRALLEKTFRLSGLTVGEMAKVSCQIAAKGEPPQEWKEDELLALMLQVRAPGQEPTQSAEVQAAFAQIVCRELWDKRLRKKDIGVAQAESMLHDYLERTLQELKELKEPARQLLEDHFISSDGSRTLLMEQQAQEALAGLTVEQARRILDSLSAAAVLHWEEHGESRYYELGHDWLARKVVDWKRTKKLQARRKQNWIRVGALASVVVSLLLGSLFVWAVRQWDTAKQAQLLAENASFAAANAQQHAETARKRAREHALMAGVRELLGSGRPELASKLLLAIDEPEQARGWVELALELLASNMPQVTVHCDKEVTTAVFSPDGMRFAVSCEDGTVQLWNADGSGPIAILPGHAAPIVSAAFSPDGKHLVTASHDAKALVWRTDDPSQPPVELKHPDIVTSAAYSRDGSHIATISEDDTVWVWNADGSGEPVILKGHEGTINSAAFSPDGLRIVTASIDRTARVWRVDGSGSPVVLRGHEGSVWTAAFSPNSQRIVTASGDNTARVWRVDGVGPPVVLRGHGSNVWSAAFSPDGAYVVTASTDKTARVWRATGEGKPIILEGHDAQVLSAAYDQDGRRIVTTSLDNTARVWNADGSGQPLVLRRHVAPVLSAAFSPDGQRIITASSDGTARVWRTDGAGQPIVLRGHEDAVTSAAFSPDGNHIATASNDNTVRVWQTDGGGEPLVLRGHEAPVTSVTFSRDGHFIASASNDKTVRVWEVDDWSNPFHPIPGKSIPLVDYTVRPFLLLRGHKDTVWAAGFSPDSQFLVTASSDKTMRVWETSPPGKSIRQQELKTAVWSASYSPNGRYIVTASRDGTARVWESDGSGQALELREHEAPEGQASLSQEGRLNGITSNDKTAPVVSAAFNKDSNRIVVSYNDNKARVWRIDGSRPPVVLQGHKDIVTSAAFSPNGNFIVTASRDKTARVWSADGQQLFVLKHDAHVLSAAFSPDGLSIVTASRDKTARVWPVGVSQLRTLLLGANFDCLTPDLRQIYLDESEEEARSGYGECEHLHGRDSSSQPVP